MRKIEQICVLVPTSEKSQIPSLGYTTIRDILCQAFPEIAVNPIYADSTPSDLTQADMLVANLYSTLGFVQLQKTLNELINGDADEFSVDRPFITAVGGTGALNPLPIKDSVDYITLDESNLVCLISYLTGKEARPWKIPDPIWAATEYITLIMPTLSCRYDCAFCQLKNQNNGIVQSSDIKAIRQLVDKMNPGRILVHSANILQYQFFDELVELLEDSKAEIFLGSMNLVDINEQIARQLVKLRPKHTIASEKDATVQLYLGLESGSAEMLKRMKKPLTPEIALEKARILSEAGFSHMGFYLIVGYPGTTEKDSGNTANVLNNIGNMVGKEGKISVKCTPFIPHLGTEVSTQPARRWAECTKELRLLRDLSQPNIDYEISDPFYYLTSIVFIRGTHEHSRLLKYLANQEGTEITCDENMETLLKQLSLPSLDSYLNGQPKLDLSYSKLPFVRTTDL